MALMIINIRGTSGSGKSTIVRTVMEEYPVREPKYVTGKKRPRGYFCKHPRCTRPLFVVGHYEILCGGADTISDILKQFEYVRWAHEEGYDVLCEGLFMSSESKQMIKLHESGAKIIVLGIKRSLTSCYEDANRRKREVAEQYGRLYKGDYNLRNVRGKHVGTQSSMRKLKAHGIQCEWYHREACLQRVKKLLGLEERNYAR